MGLHGRQLSPTRGYNDSDIRVIDDISSSFNSVLTTFNLTDGGAVYRAYSEEQVLVQLGGIIQKPKTDYTIDSTATTPQITFTTAPATGLSCDIRSIHGASWRTVSNDQVKRRSLDIAESADPTVDINAGDLYYNTTESELRVYNGTEWDTAGGGGASKVYSKTVFAYQNVINSNISISSPYNTGVIYTDAAVTVDIESGVQVDVDDNCVLSVVNI